jgi:hypothetical protein
MDTLSTLSNNAGTEYLRFGEQNIKELLKTKLTSAEDSNFTSQMFEDGNLAILIESFSYMASILLYYLNSAASESIFDDTTLYENMNRIVKMLGYNPHGFVTSSVYANIVYDEESLPVAQQLLLPRYVYTDTKRKDANGNSIYYSTVRDYNFSAEQPASIQLYNGRWQAYSTPIKAMGIPFESYVLDNISLPTGNVIADGHIHVYVSNNNNGYDQYTQTSTLYDHGMRDKVFEARLNESKQYTIKFGDGINGTKLTPSSEIIILYLQSNGSTGTIDASVLGKESDKGQLVFDIPVVGLSKSSVVDILDLDVSSGSVTLTKKQNDINTGTYNRIDLVGISNTENSSPTIDFESVDSIRESAPKWFRMSNRLITSDDFKEYVLKTFNEIHDITVMNNAEYTTEFLQWLERYDKLTVEIARGHYKYTDACDFNNVYLWLKSINTSDTSTTLKRNIIDACRGKKALTSEVIPLNPVTVSISPCFVSDNTDDVTKDNLFDVISRTRIRITRDRNTLVTIERIKQNIIKSLNNFFDMTELYLGESINLDALFLELMSIEGISRIDTVLIHPDEVGMEPSERVHDKTSNKISYATWSEPVYMDKADLAIVHERVDLYSFQYPRAHELSNWVNMIEISADNYITTELEY